ncbi:salutaridine reductase-like [Cornus florida]|uniref:salutaridine reductase-like n=1 Tax=Cornus florida TaxID=4283 RepID=UPI0028973D39|nr:salutaridine reductase-like [Cornus florida]
MEETTNSTSTAKRYAVVTGANKGIGLEICRQLASNGIAVILTARDEKKGVEAIDNLKVSGLSDMFFHQLDVNNAGILGLTTDHEAYRDYRQGGGIVSDEDAHLLDKLMKQTYEMTQECLKTNYYGTKGVTEALLPLLQLSNSARIVNVSSVNGQLSFINNEKVKEELQNVDSLTEEKIDKILLWFLMDFKEYKLQANGWPLIVSAYKVSKAAINAYTKLVARKFPDFRVNCVHPGYVKTDMNDNTGNLTPEEGARAPVMLALLPDNGPSGSYYDEMHASIF